MKAVLVNDHQVLLEVCHNVALACRVMLKVALTTCTCTLTSLLVVKLLMSTTSFRSYRDKDNFTRQPRLLGQKTVWSSKERRN